MSFSIDLQRVIWHELGHLCVDMLINEKFPEYDVSEFKLKYHVNAYPPYKWGGSIVLNPSIQPEIYNEDSELVSLCLIGCLAGCVYQTVFLNRIIKNESIKFENCFSLNRGSGGLYDCRSYNNIQSHHRKNNVHSQQLIEFLTSELHNLFVDLLIRNQTFIDGLNEYSLVYVNHGLQYFNETDSEINFSFSADYLGQIKVEIFELMNETNFSHSLKNLVLLTQESLDIGNNT